MINNIKHNFYGFEFKHNVNTVEKFFGDIFYFSYGMTSGTFYYMKCHILNIETFKKMDIKTSNCAVLCIDLHLCSMFFDIEYNKNIKIYVFENSSDDEVFNKSIYFYIVNYQTSIEKMNINSIPLIIIK